MRNLYMYMYKQIKLKIPFQVIIEVPLHPQATLRYALWAEGIFSCFLLALTQQLLPLMEDCTFPSVDGGDVNIYS